MDEKMKKFIPLFVIMGLALVGFGIYIVVNRLGMATVAAQTAGFWLGLWQGCIVFISFVVSWFDKDISIYQAGNVGIWYNLGYILGLCVALGGGAKASQNKNKSC